MRNKKSRRQKMIKQRGQRPYNFFFPRKGNDFTWISNTMRIKNKINQLEAKDD